MRALYESGSQESIKVVAINDAGDSRILSHLFQFDSTHGKFSGDVSLTESNGQKIFNVNGDAIKVFQHSQPEELPWQKEQVDVVMECSGAFRTYQRASKHIAAGAKKVIIGAPAFDEVDRTVVQGVNEHLLNDDDKIISMASCTTNCMAPILQEINRQFGIVSGLFTTIHSYSNNQRLVDGLHEDPRRARSATQSLIPTSSGAIDALGKVIPELADKMSGYSMRVPTLNVAAVDMTLQLKNKVSVEDLNSCIKNSKNVKEGLVEYNGLPLVSKDFYHNPSSAIFDATQTQVINELAKIVAWYDNEWGYANRMLDVARLIGEK